MKILNGNESVHLCGDFGAPVSILSKNSNEPILVDFGIREGILNSNKQFEGFAASTAPKSALTRL